MNATIFVDMNPEASFPQSAHYLPFMSGSYSTAPGLHRLGTDFGNGEADYKIFQLDAEWPIYRRNKESCRKEDISKYYCRQQEKNESVAEVCRFIMVRLINEYPAIFSMVASGKDRFLHNRLSRETISYSYDGSLLGPTYYLSLLDALSFQIQEDLAIWQVDGDQDWMSTIHLCAPNHWAPAEKVGKPFSEVHMQVAGMERMRERYQPMLKSILRGGTYVRFAWGLATDTRLNHHPEAPSDHDDVNWMGRSFDPNHPELYVRIERQTLTGLRSAQAALFTIRTYFEPVDEMNTKQKIQLKNALESMSEESLRYKGLQSNVDLILDFLSK